MKTWFCVLGHRDGLRWVLDHERMAFERHRLTAARKLAVGDTLLLYTTRGCYLNPTLTLSRVIGSATVLEPVRDRAEPVTIAGRSFTADLGITIERLAPYPEGVEVAALVPRLRTFPNKSGWSARLRAPLVPVDPLDVPLLVTDGVDDVEAAKETYRRWAPRG